MTEINLMPPVLVEKRKGRWRNVIIGLALGGIILLLTIWYAGIVIGVKEKEAKLQKITKQIEDLQPKLIEIKQLEVEITEMKKRVEVIVQLDKGRFLWAHLLDEMSQSLPSGVWLKDFNYSSGSSLDFSGSAFDNFSIANFMNNLINSTTFTNIVLGSIESTSIGDYPIKTFSMKCDFRG